jgi:Holliday junction resolvase
MSVPARYLEAAKIEEVSQQLRDQGYTVVNDYSAGSTRFDILATKGDQTIVVEVKARSTLQDTTEQVRRHRRIARDSGFTEYRLVVVNPPRERTIEIEDLDIILYAHMINETYQELDQLSSNTILDSITVEEIDSLAVSKSGIHVLGSGYVEVTLEYGGGNERDGLSMGSSFPFDFDVVLNHFLQVEEENSIKVDDAMCAFCACHKVETPLRCAVLNRHRRREVSRWILAPSSSRCTARSTSGCVGSRGYGAGAWPRR